MNYSYTANDLPLTKTDARNISVTFSYNTRNLTTNVNYSDSTPDVTFGYDDFGARLTAADGEGATSYVYNSFRQLQSETRTFLDLGNKAYKLSYSYNLADQLKQVNYRVEQVSPPSTLYDKNVNYRYRSRGGALDERGTNLIGSDPNAGENVLNTLTYRASGALNSLIYGNGRRLTMGYNANRQQPISMKVDRASNPSDKIIDYQYDYYDANGNNNNRIRKVTDSIDPAYTTNYQYDEQNRLTNATASGYTRSYQHDNWGNITNFSGVTHNYATNYTGAPATNRISSTSQGTSFSYDAAGNMTQAGGTAYSYDGAGRLKQVNGLSNTYGYDANGGRIRVLSGGAEVFYVRSSMLGQVAMEVSTSGVKRVYVYAGSKLVAQQSTDGQFYWVHTNHLGSARAMTDVNGNLAYKGQFDPYGQALTEWSSSGNTNLNTKKFTGYERDATGLDYANARMYNSGRGRFMQADPMGLGAANLKSPQSLNRFAYVNNDPVNYIDRRGLFGEMSLCNMVSYTPIGGNESGWGLVEYRCLIFGGTGTGTGSTGTGIEIDLSGLANLTAQKQCPANPEQLAKVDDYLKRSGIDATVATTEVAANGNGYILTFNDPAKLSSVLGNKDYWAGGSYGGQLHEKELREKFGLDKDQAHYLDYRSFNGGNTVLGDLSMQVTLIFEDKDRQVLRGAYVDVDRFNFRQDLVGAVGHTGELVVHSFKKIFGKDCP
ncbi:MAG: RHS repeat domain-containing protein [Blastocatellales bacterium]